VPKLLNAEDNKRGYMVKKIFGVVILLAILICGSPSDVGAENVPVLTLELAIVHGKLSTPKEKREVSKARLDVPLDEKERKIELKFSNPYSTTSSAGQQTQFIDSATPAFTITARPAPGGAEASVRARYKVLVSVPEAYAVGGVSPKMGIRGFEVETRISLPAKEGASVELGSIEDPVTDRAWSASITVSGVKGAVSSGVLRKNMVLTAKAEESEGKNVATTTLRVASCDAAREAKVSDELMVPYPATSASGTSAQFISLSNALMVTPDSKGSGLAKAWISTARQRGSGKEPWQRFETEYNAALLDGVPADLGSIFEGGRSVRATLEKSEK
jgi:hypothetical protein